MIDGSSVYAIKIDSKTESFNARFLSLGKHTPAACPLDPLRPLSGQPAVQRRRLADAVYDLGTTWRNVILHGISRVMRVHRRMRGQA